MLTGFTPPEETGWQAGTGTPRGDAQDRDLVAARVNPEQVPAAGGGLDRTLGSQARARARAARGERRPR